MKTTVRISAFVVLALFAGSFAGDSHVRGQDPTSFDADPIVTLDHQLAEAQLRVDRAEARKARLDAELAGLGAAKESAEARLKLRARSLYRLTRAGMLPLMGGMDAMLSHLARVNRLERMVERDAASFDSLRGRGATLRAELSELGHEILQTHTDVQALERRKAALVAERDAQLQNVAFPLASPGLEVALPAASGVTELPYGTLRVLGDDVSPNQSDFASERGRLSMPVSGDMQIRDDDGADGQALLFTLRGNTSVRAVAAGRVVFAGSQANQGRLVIVDHGDRYFTVYGGLSTLDAEVGDDLSRGARLGAVGGSNDLRFEVRRGTRNLPPRDWLGL